MPALFRLACALTLLVAAPLRAQTAAPADRYWITVDAFVPGPAPSERARERRALRGTGTPVVDRRLAPAARAALARLGVAPVVESGWLGAVSAVLTPEQRRTVAALPFVRGVRPVARLAPVEAPAALEAPRPVRIVDAGPSLAQLQTVRADEMLDLGFDGREVLVGFLDTLFDFDHPALAHLGADGRLVEVRDFTGGQAQSNFHGLSTSSVAFGDAAGELVGPARGARAIAGTTEFAPTETHAEEDYFIAGMEWMEAQGADVVNVSLGYQDFDDGDDYVYADLDGDTTPFTRAADRAVSLGVVVVASAGNEGSNSWFHITAPADADSVITVGAVRADRTVASFSSRGPTADGRTKPDVMAQGADVYVARAGGGYGFSNGTSFSAPMVAGIAAQLLSYDPSLTPIQLREVLRQTASQPTAPDNDYGWGIVDAAAALDALLVAAEPDPTAARWRVWPTVLSPGGELSVEADARFGLSVVDVLGRRVAGFEHAGGVSRQALPTLAPGLYLIVPDDAPQAPLRIVVR